MPLDTEIGLGPGDTVLHGDPAPKKGHSSRHFAAHVCCGQTPGWIKMSLRTEVGLCLGHIVLDRDPAPFPQKGHSPQFSAIVCCGQMAGLIKILLGTEVGINPLSMFIVAKRLDGSRCHLAQATLC